MPALPPLADAGAPSKSTRPARPDNLSRTGQSGQADEDWTLGGRPHPWRELDALPGIRGQTRVGSMNDDALFYCADVSLRFALVSGGLGG